ncbi:MAG TPA: MBL fold metallo-hydrolase [Tenuifilaceae bacterium]|nr:MBL fold metallo-hydrolase [Tenuifilaceae bacterium]
MKIKQFVLNPFQENTYLLYDETGEAIIVDAGCYTPSEAAEVKRFTDDNKLTVKYLVNTHCHIDHILGINALRDIYSVDCYAHREELPTIQMAPQHAMMFGLVIDTIPMVEKTIDEGDELKFGNSALQVIHTPGHTPGCVSLYSANDRILLTGDTLFQGSIGRTDLGGGSFETIIQSITNKLLTLPDDVMIFPGHGDFSTIGKERVSNPFLKN